MRGVAAGRGEASLRAQWGVGSGWVLRRSSSPAETSVLLRERYKEKVCCCKGGTALEQIAQRGGASSVSGHPAVGVPVHCRAVRLDGF